MRDARLPLVTFYLTERCNSRCVTCDYWRHGRADATLESVLRVVPDLRRLGTRVALLSGGEPLMNPEWRDIARALRDAGVRPWLLTSGLSLAKHAAVAAEAFETITVSMDGTNSTMYAAIRGLDAFDKVCEGARVAARAGAAVSLRVTLQRTNYRELPRFVAVAREIGARQVSFLAVDVANAHAFARSGPVAQGLALDADDVARFGALVDTLEHEEAAAFESGFIAESPAKLRRLRDYFGALCGLCAYPPVRCNAPAFSAVVGVDGRVSPCFFIAGTGADTQAGLAAAIDDPAMEAQRAGIARGERAECARCVCSMWRDPESFDVAQFGVREAAHA
jgi:MoaA/NifB/PqqE/SkfB family radical SAM enzyme